MASETFQGSPISVAWLLNAKVSIDRRTVERSDQLRAQPEANVLSAQLTADLNATGQRRRQRIGSGTQRTHIRMDRYIAGLGTHIEVTNAYFEEPLNPISLAGLRPLPSGHPS